MEGEIRVLDAQADEDAVNIYMNPDPTVAVMDTEDLTTATRREALLATIASSHSDVLDRLEGLRVDLVAAQERAEAAQAQVEAERAEVQARLADYQGTLAEQERLEGELERRIADVEAESAALAEEEAAIRAALARASQAPTLPDGSPDVPPPSAGLLQFPTTGTITGVFGEDRGDHMHAGIDIANSEGTAIVAAKAGTVISGCGGGYGNCVLVDHGGGMVTLYAHRARSAWAAARSAGATYLGAMGCTGSCTGPHLHFEIRINGSPVDPMGYLLGPPCACNWWEGGEWVKPFSAACSTLAGPRRTRSASSRPYPPAGTSWPSASPTSTSPTPSAPPRARSWPPSRVTSAPPVPASGADAGRVLSIAAGVRLADLEAALPDGTPVVRAMPNTPALVGAGAAAIAGGTAAGDDDLAWAESILSAVGTVVRVAEPLLDAVTGLSGSGPAYVFLVAEALIEAGVLVGLPRPVAAELAVQTLLGSARLLAEGDDGPEALRAAVTSPGGTTAAGLRALEQAGVRAAFLDAVVAATERSRELG